MPVLHWCRITTDTNCCSVWGREIASHPPAPRCSTVGGLRFSQKICRGPIFHVRCQKTLVATALRCAAVSSDQQLKSLQENRSHRAFEPQKLSWAVKGGRSGEFAREGC